MQIRLKKQDLATAVPIVQSIASTQTSLPILNNVLLKTDHNNLVSLSATDFETRARIEVAADVAKKGEITIPARMFCDLIKELPDDSEIVIEAKEKNASIQCRSIHVDLATMPARDYPGFPEVEPRHTFDIEQRTLKAQMNKVLFAIPAKDPRKMLLGALFEFRDGDLIMVATDGKILAHAKRKLSSDRAPKNLSVVVPHKILEELGRHLDDEGLVTVALDDRQIAFRFGSVLLVSNLIDGKYPNYENVIPKEFSREFKFRRGDMLQALRRASIMTDVKSNSVVLDFRDGGAEVEAESYERGRFAETIPATAPAEGFKISFNYKFLQEAIKEIEADEIILQANQPASPAVIRGTDIEDYFYLVMPIKVADVRDYSSESSGDDEGEYEEAESQ